MGGVICNYTPPTIHGRWTSKKINFFKNVYGKTKEIDPTFHKYDSETSSKSTNFSRI